MKLTDTGLVETKKPRGGWNFICDDGGYSQKYMATVFCDSHSVAINQIVNCAIRLYFNDDISGELNRAFEQCIGEGFFKNIRKLDFTRYVMGSILSNKHRGCEKLCEYIRDYVATKRDIKYLVVKEIIFQKGNYNIPEQCFII